jgi:hypothetical protein
MPLLALVEIPMKPAFVGKADMAWACGYFRFLTHFGLG